MGTVKVKICGLTREEDVEYANAVKPDFVGWVFAPRSRRYVSRALATRLRAALDDAIQAVGVFVDSPIDEIVSLAREGAIAVAQLHGHEDEAYVEELRSRLDAPIVRAFRVASSSDVEAASRTSADYPLLDNGVGGTGQTFDWRIFSGMSRPFFLAGGLSPSNVGTAIERFRPYCVDLSSGVETDGYKDYLKMKSVVEEARRISATFS